MVIEVPLPGLDSITHFPPNSAALSRIADSPVDALEAEVSNPRP